MMTLRQIESGQIGGNVPMAVTWYLSDLGEAKGKQELFTRQSRTVLRSTPEGFGLEDPARPATVGA
jgi:hypothetical protein